MQQFREVLRASMVASAYASKAGCIKEPVMVLFCDQMAAVTMVRRGRILLIVFESNQGKKETLSANRATPTISEIIVIFLCSSVFSDWMKKKTPTITHDY